MESQIVTLTTDWGYKDFFQGKVKGKLYSYIPGVRVVDITHGIEPFQLSKAVFVAKNSCLDFPEGTIHIIDVKSSQTVKNPFVVIRYKGQYFVTIDNGLPGALVGDGWEGVVIDKVMQEGSFFTFAASDLFCKVAALLAHGAALEELGFPLESLYRSTPFSPIVMGNKVTAYVCYIDAYGNADLNITYEEFERLRQGRKFRMTVRERTLDRIEPGYLDAVNNRFALILTVSSSGNLQIAMCENSAEQFFGLKVDFKVDIEFF